MQFLSRLNRVAKALSGSKEWICCPECGDSSPTAVKTFGGILEVFRSMDLPQPPLVRDVIQYHRPDLLPFLQADGRFTGPVVDQEVAAALEAGAERRKALPEYTCATCGTRRHQASLEEIAAFYREQDLPQPEELARLLNPPTSNAGAGDVATDASLPPAAPSLASGAVSAAGAGTPPGDGQTGDAAPRPLFSQTPPGGEPQKDTPPPVQNKQGCHPYARAKFLSKGLPNG